MELWKCTDTALTKAFIACIVHILSNMSTFWSLLPTRSFLWSPIRIEVGTKHHTETMYNFDSAQRRKRLGPGVEGKQFCHETMRVQGKKAGAGGWVCLWTRPVCLQTALWLGRRHTLTTTLAWYGDASCTNKLHKHSYTYQQLHWHNKIDIHNFLISFHKIWLFLLE